MATRNGPRPTKLLFAVALSVLFLQAAWCDKPFIPPTLAQWTRSSFKRREVTKFLLRYDRENWLAPLELTVLTFTESHGGTRLTVPFFWWGVRERIHGKLEGKRIAFSTLLDHRGELICPNSWDPLASSEEAGPKAVHFGYRIYVSGHRQGHIKGDATVRKSFGAQMLVKNRKVLVGSTNLNQKNLKITPLSPGTKAGAKIERLPRSKFKVAKANALPLALVKWANLTHDDPIKLMWQDEDWLVHLTFLEHPGVGIDVYKLPNIPDQDPQLVSSVEVVHFVFNEWQHVAQDKDRRVYVKIDERLALTTRWKD